MNVLPIPQLIIITAFYKSILLLNKKVCNPINGLPKINIPLIYKILLVYNDLTFYLFYNLIHFVTYSNEIKLSETNKTMSMHLEPIMQIYLKLK